MKGRVGRILSDAERLAWYEYDEVLNELDKKHGVKAYDRVSVMKAFPELQEAFDKCRAATTFYHLTKEYGEET